MNSIALVLPPGADPELLEKTLNLMRILENLKGSMDIKNSKSPSGQGKHGFQSSLKWLNILKVKGFGVWSGFFLLILVLKSAGMVEFPKARFSRKI